MSTCLFAAAVLLVSVAFPPEAQAEEAGRTDSGGRLTVRIAGLQPNVGSVAVAIFDSAEAFDARTPAVRKIFLETDSTTLGEWIVDGLSPGTYAILAYQDVNGNRILDRRKIGIPKEPYGFSNNARATFGPPTFEAARFTYEGGDEIVEFRLRGRRR